LRNPSRKSGEGGDRVNYLDAKAEAVKLATREFVSEADLVLPWLSIHSHGFILGCDATSRAFKTFNPILHIIHTDDIIALETRSPHTGKIKTADIGFRCSSE